MNAAQKKHWHNFQPGIVPILYRTRYEYFISVIIRLAMALLSRFRDSTI